MGLNAKVGAYLNIVHLHFVASQSCKDFGVLAVVVTKSKRDDYK